MVRLFLLSCPLIIAAAASAMELALTRTTGQFRYEATPMLVDLNGDGSDEILGPNLGGQVLAWTLDGKDFGSGQDGLIAQLPEGTWCSQGAVGPGPLYVFCSLEGLVVGLDASWQVAWQHQLPGKTQYSRAVPLLLEGEGGPFLYIGDLSGAITCLDEHGKVLYTKQLESGPCISELILNPYGEGVIASSGTTVYALTSALEQQWRKDVQEQVQSRPLVVQGGQPLLVVATKEGSVVALDGDGAEQWRAKIGEELDSTLTLLPSAERPLIVTTGLWGNAHALTVEGKPVWSHLFRSKVRARPLVFDVNGDGAEDVLIATYAQHAYALDRTGNRIDDIRLSGSINAAPLALPTAQPEVLFISTTLQAHRFRQGAPRPLFGEDAEFPCADELSLETSGQPRAVLVKNPKRQLLRVNVESTASTCNP